MTVCDAITQTILTDNHYNSTMVWCAGQYNGSVRGIIKSINNDRSVVIII